MTAESAGLLLFRRAGGRVEVLLVLPGGPYWSREEPGAWQIPKGGIEPGEDALAAALRETREEIGHAIAGDALPLGHVRQKAGKIVHAYAIGADLDAAAIRSEEFEMEWPPRSGRMARFPEVARARWFALEEAATMMLESQRPFLDRLRAIVGGD